MKLKTLLSVLLLSSIFSLSLIAQCDITNLEVTSTGCDVNGTVTIQYDFDVINPGSSNTFKLYVNGGYSGELEYDQGPYTYGLLWGDCDITHSIRVEDSNDSNCSADYTFGEPFCCWEEGCNMTLDLDFAGECNDNGEFYVTLLVANPGGSSGGFETVINGVSFGWIDYGNTLYEFGPLAGDCETIYEFTVTDWEDEECTLTTSLNEPICCDSCDDMIVDYVGTNQCNESGTFFMELLIDHPTSETFDVYIGNVYFGTYEYGEEVYSFGPFQGDCSTERNINIQDLSLFCESQFTVEPVCCPAYCTISDITVEAIECTGDQTFSIELDFEYNEVEETEFDFWANGVYHGTYAYAELPIIITDYPVHPNPFVTVFGIGADALCANDFLFEGFTECSTSCTISDVYAEAHECNDQGEIFVDIEFSVDNPGISNLFTIQGNGTNYGTFEYGQTYYTVGPFTPDCDLYYEFIVIDVDNNDCLAFYEFSNSLCCEANGECDLNTLDFGANPSCDGDFIVTEWLIDGSYLSEVGFDIFINNEFETFVPWNNDSWYDFDIVSPETENFTIKICDNDNGECCIEWELDNPCYDPTSNDCIITGVEAEAFCTDDELFAVVWFDNVNPGISNQFSIDVNGQEFGPFEYGETNYDVGPLEFPCDQAQFINVTDLDNNDCTGFFNLELPIGLCCQTQECTIIDLTAVAHDCNEEGELYFDIYFDVDNPGADNQFTVVGNGNNYGTFEYGQDFYTVGPFLANCETEVELIVTDLNNTDCTTYYGFNEIFCCEENECALTTLDFGPNPICQDGLIVTEWLIDGEQLSEVGFDIFINGNFETFVEWNNDSWYDFDIVNPETENFTIKICDNDNEECCIEWELDNPCYDANNGNDECIIDDINISPSCDGNSTYFELDFEYDNNNSSTFEVLVNDDYSETFSYSDLPVNVFGLEYDTDYITVTITDNENANCTISTEFENPCYDNGDLQCGIFDLEVDASDCNDDGEIYFTISFYANNPGADNQFTVLGNGNTYGIFEYGEESYAIGPFAANCETEAELIIRDINNNDCIAVWESNETFCCEDDLEDCLISEVSVQQQDCDDQNQVYFTLSFNYESNGVSNQFTVVGNGSNYGTFEYGLDFYQVGPVIADCETELEFIVTDLEDNDCSAFMGHDPVCCEDDVSCTLLELSLDPSECFDDEMFNMVLDVEVIGNTNDFFDLNINGDFVGFYEFEALPITLENLAYETEYISVEVCENDTPDCCITLDIENPCLEDSSQQFFINEIEVEFISCEGDLISMSLDLEHGDNDDQFSVSANGISFGNFNYSELPVIIENIPADGVIDYTFTVFDTTIDDVSDSIFIGTLACDGNIILDVDDTLLDPANIKSIEAYDITGKLLGLFDSVENIKTLDTGSSVSSGIIILRIDYGTTIMTKKIVRVN